MIRLGFILLLIAATTSGYQCKNNRSSMTENNEIENTQLNWHTIAKFGEEIYVADMNGVLAQVSLENGMSSSAQTGLDIPYLLTSEQRLTAIGRWDTRITSWNLAEDGLEYGSSIVTGRITAVSNGGGLRFVAGSDKAVVEGSINEKDRVQLAPGKIFQLNEVNQPVLFPAEVKGQIHLLANSKSWLAFVDSGTKTKIHTYNLSSGEGSMIETKETITALMVAEESLYYATASEITKVNIETKLQIETITLPDDFPRILKLAISGTEVFLLTSEGVFNMMNLQQISKHSGQPSDIATYKDGLLTLWQDGTIEHYVSGEVVNVIQLEEINSE